MTTAPAAAPQPVAPRPVAKRVETLVKNLICLTLWVWGICRLFGLHYPVVQPGEVWHSIAVVLHTTIAKVLAAALVVTLVLLKKVFWSVRFVGGFMLRLAFFPFIFAYYAIALPRRALRLAAPPINTLVGHVVTTTIAKAGFVLLVLFSASFYLLLSHQQRGWISVGIVLLATAIAVTFRIAVFWTGKPLVWLEQALHVVYRVADFLMRIATHDVKPREKPEDAKKAFESLESQVKNVSNLLAWCEKVIARRSETKAVVGVFVVLLSVCLAVDVTAFGLIYFALQQLNPASFPDAATWNLGDCLFKSLIVITTSGDIGPLTPGAKIAVASEILAGVWLLGWLVFQYSVVSIPQVVEHRDAILNVLSSKRDDAARAVEDARKAMFPELAVHADATVVQEEESNDEPPQPAG